MLGTMQAETADDILGDLRTQVAEDAETADEDDEMKFLMQLTLRRTVGALGINKVTPYELIEELARNGFPSDEHGFREVIEKVHDRSFQQCYMVYLHILSPVVYMLHISASDEFCM